MDMVYEIETVVNDSNINWSAWSDKKIASWITENFTLVP